MYVSIILPLSTQHRFTSDYLGGETNHFGDFANVGDSAVNSIMQINSNSFVFNYTIHGQNMPIFYINLKSIAVVM